MKKLTLELALLTMLVVAGCATSPSGDATLDAMEPHLRACAGALAEDDMTEARKKCLPVFAVYEAGRR